MQIKRLELIAVVSLCAPGVDKGSALTEGAENILFDGSYAYSFNDTVCVIAPLPFELYGNVDGVKLLKTLKALKTEYIDIDQETHPTAWEIMAGKKIITFPFDENSIAEVVEAIGLNTNTEFAKIDPDYLSKVESVYISKNKTRYAGVYVSGKDVISSDVQIINYANLKVKAEPHWIGGKEVPMLLKQEHINAISVRGSWIVYDCGSHIFACLSREARLYPAANLMSVIGDLEDVKGDMEFPLELEESLKLASAVVDVKKPFITLRFNGKRLTVMGKSAKGEFIETLRLSGESNFKCVVKLTIPDLSAILKRGCRTFSLYENGDAHFLIIKQCKDIFIYPPVTEED